jgi:hypothetical protein
MAALGPPAYIQSLLAAKAASGFPFMPPSIPMGPPPFIQQLIAAKNAAAAQQAAEEAAMAQQLAAAGQIGGGAASPVLLYHPLTGTTNPFAQNILGSPSEVTPGGGDPQSLWLQQLLASQMAKKLSSNSVSGDGSSLTSGAQPVGYSGGWGSPSISGLQQRRDLVPGEGDAQQASMTPPVPGAYPPFPMGFPPMSPLAPMPYPMMPFFPPMPMWKMMG